jgi:hypothetical protein
MEVYWNSIEMVTGITRSAEHCYEKKDAKDLQPYQAAGTKAILLI